MAPRSSASPPHAAGVPGEPAACAGAVAGAWAGAAEAGAALPARVSVVGRGRLGKALARALAAVGVEVAGPSGRGEPVAAADATILCVPDGEIAAAAAAAAGSAPLIGHVSGATGLDALATAGATAFGLHPLQTFAAAGEPLGGEPLACEPLGEAGREPVREVAEPLGNAGREPLARFAGAGCAIAGETPAALAAARSLAVALGMRPFEVADGDRAAYHAAASIASNFTVTLLAEAERVAGAAGIEPAQARELLAPLVRSTVENWAALGPERALTGPVARGDEETVARQREALASAAPELEPLFDELVARTRALARHGVEALA